MNKDALPILLIYDQYTDVHMSTDRVMFIRNKNVYQTPIHILADIWYLQVSTDIYRY